MDRNQEHKADGGKLMMELIPTSAIKSLAAVLTYGAKKYEPNSWQRVERERYVGAILRHLVAYIDNPTGKDEESGLMHIEHVLCNAAFLNDMAQKQAKPAEWYEGKYKEWVNDSTRYDDASQDPRVMADSEGNIRKLADMSPDAIEKTLRLQAVERVMKNRKINGSLWNTVFGL